MQLTLSSRSCSLQAVSTTPLTAATSVYPPVLLTRRVPSAPQAPASSAPLSGGPLAAGRRSWQGRRQGPPPPTKQRPLAAGTRPGRQLRLLSAPGSDPIRHFCSLVFPSLIPNVTPGQGGRRLPGMWRTPRPSPLCSGGG